MQALLRDIRYGLRSLGPGLVTVATVALTFGIGLTTTMFSITYGALIKGLPFSEGDRIVLRAVIHAPGRFGSFYGPTGLRTPGGGPAPLHAVASAIQRGTE